MVKLTAMQKDFADEYILTGNVTESARKAGYKQPHVQGSRTLENVSVLEYIEERMKSVTTSKIMNQKEALELLTSIARAEVTEELYIPTEKGVQRIEKLPDIRDRQRAIEALLKRYPISKHEDLRNQMLEMQIKKLEKDVNTESSVEDKLKEYFTALGGAFGGEES